MQYVITSRTGGKVLRMIEKLRENMAYRVVVSDVWMLDLLVRSGVQPSQIILPNELKPRTDFWKVSLWD